MTSNTAPSEVARIVTAHRQREGGGFIVRRPFPAPGRIPSATSQDGLAQVKVIAGEAFGVKARIDTHTPLEEPAARSGPFVMTTEAQILQAMRDFQSGRMGEIARNAQID